MLRFYKSVAVAGMIFAASQAHAVDELAPLDVGQKCCPFSDQSLKTSVQSLTHSTDHLLKLQGAKFTWKDSGREDIGLIAQNVKEVYPELVHEKQGLLTVDYEKLVAPLIESVRELNARIEVLEKAQ